MVVRRGGAGGAVLVWWALGYRKAAGVFGLAMLARFGLSLVFKAHETAVGIGAGPPPRLKGKDSRHETSRQAALVLGAAARGGDAHRRAARSVERRVSARRQRQRLSPRRAASALPRAQRPPCRRARVLAAAIRYLTAPIGRELRASASRPPRSATETSARGEKEARSSHRPARRRTPALPEGEVVQALADHRLQAVQQAPDGTVPLCRLPCKRARSARSRPQPSPRPGCHLDLPTSTATTVPVASKESRSGRPSEGPVRLVPSRACADPRPGVTIARCECDRASSGSGTSPLREMGSSAPDMGVASPDFGASDCFAREAGLCSTSGLATIQPCGVATDRIGRGTSARSPYEASPARVASGRSLCRNAIVARLARLGGAAPLSLGAHRDRAGAAPAGRP